MGICVGAASVETPDALGGVSHSVHGNAFIDVFGASLSFGGFVSQWISDMWFALYEHRFLMQPLQNGYSSGAAATTFASGVGVLREQCQLP